MPALQVYTVCGTSHPPKGEDHLVWWEEVVGRLEEAVEDGFFRYLAWGQELGEEGVSPHVQWYGVCAQRTTFKAIKEAVKDNTVHLENRQGTHVQARDYVFKEALAWGEVGDEPEETAVKAMAKGRQAHAAELMRCLDEEGLLACKAKFPHEYLFHKKMLLAYLVSQRPDPEPLPKRGTHLWVYGPPETGKSTWARSTNGKAYVKDVGKWWDNYAEQGYPETVVIEDFDQYMRDQTRWLKVVADVQPFPAEIKGSSLGLIRPKMVIVTSNYSIDQIWEQGKDRDAMHSRFLEMEKLTLEDEPVIVLKKVKPEPRPAFAPRPPPPGGYAILPPPEPEEVSSPRWCKESQKWV